MKAEKLLEEMRELPGTPLYRWRLAPREGGVYELYLLTSPLPLYCGKATSRFGGLRRRLGRHYSDSHHPLIKKHHESLYFKSVPVDPRGMAQFFEAVLIAGGEYPWNRRNEWSAHWALVDGIAGDTGEE